ncbi:uncharacterized protein A4U43_C04F260 [Asparagus officinalis]|uniref:Aquaporin n=1 Tax=Asparagus officinalis TaxID=4686 RepID=A0A5P1EZU4_ASPOF|nr:uncharacterized protein A4U43_C04F260 [Asparagus officinalis]
MVHLATIPITGTGINPARSLGPAVIFNKRKAWDDHSRKKNVIGGLGLPEASPPNEPPAAPNRQRESRRPSSYVSIAGWIAASPECVLAPLPIGFAVFMVHLATIPITGTGINPARSFGAAVIYNKDKAWDDQWIFWVGPFIGAAIAAAYHQYVLRAGAVKALGSFRSNA